MVRVPFSGGSYCIDSTEVTQEHYAAFLEATQGKTPSQPPECSWNKDLAPPAYNPDPEEYDGCKLTPIWMPKERPDWPVTCVDWCDAAAYCAWAGKRLCGKIGGGTVEKEKGNEASESQWYNACSQGGKTKYPYGDAYKPEVCVEKGSKLGTENGEPAVAPVKAAEGCTAKEGPFAGVYDLVGNVSEWEDNCFDWKFPDGSTERQCARRGGSVFTMDVNSEIYSCPNTRTGGLGAAEPWVGFRCCKD